jgi:hypothetical protein
MDMNYCLKSLQDAITELITAYSAINEEAQPPTGICIPIARVNIFASLQKVNLCYEFLKDKKETPFD